MFNQVWLRGRSINIDWEIVLLLLACLSTGQMLTVVPRDACLCRRPGVR